MPVDFDDDEDFMDDVPSPAAAVKSEGSRYSKQTFSDSTSSVQVTAKTGKNWQRISRPDSKILIVILQIQSQNGLETHFLNAVPIDLDHSRLRDRRVY